MQKDRAKEYRWIALLLPALLGAASPNPAIEGEHSSANWMQMLQGYDQRVASTGYRLTRAARDFCETPVALTGITVQDISQFDRRDQPAARVEFGYDGYPQVSAVADQSPAALAGIKPGDDIIAIDGIPVPAEKAGADNSATRSNGVSNQLDRAVRQGEVRLDLMRRGEALRLSFTPENGCPARFQVSTSDALNAATDGHIVELDMGLMELLPSDELVAAVIAHELAHDLLHHQARLAAAHVGNARSRRGARLTLETETEADRLSVYLMDRAGFSPHSIASLWALLEKERSSPLRLHTHLPPAQRIALIEAEIAHLTQLKAEGAPLRPKFMAAGALPALE